MQIFHENDFAKFISVNFTFYNLRSIKLIILSFRITYYKIRKIKKTETRACTPISVFEIVNKMWNSKS